MAARVLHLRASNFLGGPERQLIRYGHFHSDPRFAPVFATFEGSGEPFADALRKRGLECVMLPAGSWAAVVALSRYIARQEVALVCTHGYKADVLGWLACRRKVPVAFFLRGWTGEDLKVRAYELLDRTLLPLANRVVCLSETEARQCVRREALRGKIRVVVNAIEPPLITPNERLRLRREVRARFGLPPDCPLIATAGRLSPEKGTIYFIESFAAIRVACPDARGIIFGDGPLRAVLEARTRALGIANSITFAGFVPDVPRLLGGVDVVVNPSLREQMPNVVLEAMASATPVVATPVGGVVEIANEKPVPAGDALSTANIILVAEKSTSAISSAAIRLLRDPEEARATGLRARQRILQAFSPARQQEQLRALYEELIRVEPRGDAVYSA